MNLPDVVRALHDFLSANGRKLLDDDPLMTGGSPSPALERYREERARLARLDPLEREGQLLPRDRARDGLLRIAGILRSAGEALERQFGPAALEMLSEALDDADAEIERMFGADGSLTDLPQEPNLDSPSPDASPPGN